VKFLRHLAAVVFVVAVIVTLGMLWAHVSGGVDTGLGPMRVPSGKAFGPIRANLIGARPGDGFHLDDTRNLIRTCEIEAVLAAVVITVSAIRRRERRLRRAAAERYM